MSAENVMQERWKHHETGYTTNGEKVRRQGESDMERNEQYAYINISITDEQMEIYVNAILPSTKQNIQ